MNDKYLSRSIKMTGETNPQWKGSSVGYAALHLWVRRHKPNAQLCEQCEVAPSRDLANISGKYKRDINDFEWLCRSCHMKKDGRIKKLLEMHHKLTVVTAQEILNTKGKQPSKVVALKYGISRSYVRQIWCGAKWKQLNGENQ